MADRRTIARPYARAAFEEARSHGRLEEWSQALARAAATVQDPRVAALLSNPRMTPEALGQLVLEVAGAGLDAAGANFVRTLAANRRLAYLPEIAARFAELKDEAQGVADVSVTSATALEPQQQQQLAAAMERRLKRRVRLHCSTDPHLIGGAVLKSGDLVIDGSLSTRLARIAYELTA